MCFSFEISLITGIFSWSVGLFLLQKKLTKSQRNNIIFLLIFSSMQFADAVLWYIKMKKNFINFFITSFLIPTILSLQILFNVYVVNNNSNKLISLSSFALIFYIFIKLYGYSNFVCNNKYSSPIWGSKEFNFLEFVIFLLFIIYPKHINFFIGLSMILFVKFYFKGGYGSLWCFIANILSIYYLILYFNKN